MNLTLIMSLLSLAIRHQDTIAKVIQIAAPLLREATQQVATPQPQAPQQYDVRWLQASLNKLINAGLSVDGDYGAATREAVKRFQGQFMGPSDADGWAGVKTTAAILAALEEREA